MQISLTGFRLAAVGVESAAAVLLLAAIMIVVVIASIPVVKSYNDVTVHRFIPTGYNFAVTCSTANNEKPYYSTVVHEEPYYSTVSAQQPDAIEMKDNDAYVKLPPAQREIIVEENPAYTVTVQNFTRNAP